MYLYQGSHVNLENEFKRPFLSKKENITGGTQPRVTHGHSQSLLRGLRSWVQLVEHKPECKSIRSATDRHITTTAGLGVVVLESPAQSQDTQKTTKVWSATLRVPHGTTFDAAFLSKFALRVGKVVVCVERSISGNDHIAIVSTDRESMSAVTREVVDSIVVQHPEVQDTRVEEFEMDLLDKLAQEGGSFTVTFPC